MARGYAAPERQKRRFTHLYAINCCFAEQNGEIDAEKIEFGCFSAERFIAGFTSLWGMFIVRLIAEGWPSGLRQRS
ncbi:hypothetical protein PZBJ_01785 [Pantoea endophytica]|uniref:Uncharacterized protein n=1 Tax=Pantoea endophytica TaxID=92488 RepID=A0ABX4SWR6_9GAMM|nr:hypothetical protein PZBJ_01785 [Pantoea endophytica]QCP59158.1 hypothetical protein FCN45_07125 [Pantoea sp. SO10]